MIYLFLEGDSIMGMMAPGEVVDQRKREAEGDALKKGHEIGNWQLRKDTANQDTWYATCQIRNCQARVAVNPAINGGIAGPTAFLAECPYVPL